MRSINRHLSRPWFRAAIGIAISAAFVTATVASIDFDLMGEAMSRVVVGLLFVAAAVSVAELNVRVVRWRLLLGRLAAVSHGAALGYLAMGHLANATLPARLGDLTRGVLTGTRLGVSRASVLGTIALERVSDAAFLGMAAGVGVIIGFRQLAPTVGTAGLLAASALSGVIVAVIVVRREAIARTRVGRLLHVYGGRFWVGATAFRGPEDVARWIGLTAASFALTVVIFAIVADAVGMSVSVWQAALAMAAVTLSTAIPAGPASVGTYEFVGMTVMVSLGFPAEQALVCVALVHALVVLPPSVIGLAAMWLIGTGRARERLAGATSERSA